MKLKLVARLNKTAEPEALNPKEWERLADKLEIIVEKDNGHLVLKAINGDELLKQVYSVTNVEEAKKRFREYLKEQIGMKYIEERIKSFKNYQKDWDHQMETQLEKIQKKLDSITVTKLPKIEIDELIRAVKENAERVKQDKEKQGTEIVKPKYDYVGDFSEGLARVTLDGKCGFIDKTGKVVIELKYDWVGYFYEGLAEVKLNGKSGYVDKTGKEDWDMSRTKLVGK